MKTATAYDLVATYYGNGDVTDRELRRTVNRPRNEMGSGYSFFDGGRDLCWTFHTKRALDQAITRIRKTRRRTTVAIKVYTSCDDGSIITEER